MRPLDSLADLDAAVRRSHARPIVIFKHSLTCGRSAMAFEEVEELMALEPAVDIFIVSVQYGALISKEIAKRFGLRHESPQALVVSRGTVAWHASHLRVTREEIASALAAIAKAQQETLPRPGA